MYNINISQTMKNKSKWILIISISIGVILIGVGLFCVQNDRKTIFKSDEDVNIKSIKCNEKDSALVEKVAPIFDVDISLIKDSLLAGLARDTLEDYEKKYVEIYLKELYYVNDSVAIRMEILKKAQWDSLPAEPSLEIKFTKDNKEGVLSDGRVIKLRARNGKIIEYESTVPEGSTESGDDISYIGYNAALDMWAVDFVSREGTAMFQQTHHIDCRNGNVYNYGDSYDKLLYCSPDAKIIFENYANWHDGDACWIVHTVRKDSYLTSHSRVFESVSLDQVGWVNDSTLKFRMQYSYYKLEGLQKYLDALSYRVLHLNKMAAPKLEKFWEYE